MTHKRIITLWAAIVLTFAVTTSAVAQFGNILNKAKKAVKEKVKEKSEAIKEKPACRGRGMDLYRCQRASTSSMERKLSRSKLSTAITAQRTIQ